MTKSILKNYPALHRNMVLSNTSTHLEVATRQVDLEPSIAGVDRARSYSFWIRISNTQTQIQNRVINIAESTGNTNQLVINLIPSDNNTGVAQRLRCQLLTNATNLTYIQTQNTFSKGWHHVAWTYGGGEVNTDFELYVDGVVESSPTRSGTGTYTGALNSANLRMKIGNHDTSNSFVGSLKNVRVWDKKLSAAEVLEEKNNAFASISNLSFAANLVADWPLGTNAECSNNSAFNFNVTGSPVFTVSEILQDQKRISFRRAQDINSRYVAFPAIIQKDANTATIYVRSGTSHVLNGKITGIDINLTTGVASAPYDVLTDGSADLRGGSACIDDNGDIHIFSSRYNGGTDTFLNTGMYTSTDGGATFGAIELFATTETRYNFYGQCIRTGSGTFLVPFFEHDGTDFLISVFKTTDNWATHSKITVYSGTDQFTEPTLVDLQNGNLMILLRRNNSPFGIFQTLSSDVGDTWGTPTLTNLAGTTKAANCFAVLGNNGKVLNVVMDRSVPAMMRSLHNRVSTILASATAWQTPSIFFNPYAYDNGGGGTLGILGYPVALNLVDGRFVIAFSTEASASRADLYFGIGAF